MTAPPVKTATDADKASVIDAIVLAFAADPVVRWLWPDPRAYLATMPDFALAYGGEAFAHGSAYCTHDYTGAALWLPPGAHPDEEAMGQLIGQSVAPEVQADLSAALEQFGAYRPSDPHWYLPVIGVDPSCQGQGCGSALMSYALERCDRDGLPAYLESSNPRNIGLYERHGFKIGGEVQVGSSPPIVPMVRGPRGV